MLSAMSFSETLRKPKFWLIAVPVVILLAVVVGPFVYFNVIQEDAPEPLGFEDITTTTADGSTDTTAASTGAGGTTSDGIEGTWEVAAGSTAGYRATEVLFGQTNEAAGRTEDVTGTLEIDGTSATTVSIEVDLTTLSSDESIRDGQVQSRILETSQFPTATFEVTDPVALPELRNGQVASIDVTGDLTLHGVTQPVTISLDVKATGDDFVVQGSAPVVMADHEIEPPSIGGFVSVSDEGSFEFIVNLARG